MQELRPWIGSLALVDIGGEPLRFNWRLVGTEIVDQLGRDVTGKTFEEVYDADWLEPMVATFSKAVRRRSPVYFHGTLRFVDKEYRRFSLVQLPLAGNGHTVDMLMVCLDFS
jgi:hypothetical protein